MRGAGLKVCLDVECSPTIAAKDSRAWRAVGIAALGAPARPMLSDVGDRTTVIQKAASRPTSSGELRSRSRDRETPCHTLEAPAPAPRVAQVGSKAK